MALRWLVIEIEPFDPVVVEDRDEDPELNVMARELFPIFPEISITFIFISFLLPVFASL